eukprot:jgi/Ulvmu1/8596/UM045_0039.1
MPMLKHAERLNLCMGADVVKTAESMQSGKRSRSRLPAQLLTCDLQLPATDSTVCSSPESLVVVWTFCVIQHVLIPFHSLDADCNCVLALIPTQVGVEPLKSHCRCCACSAASRLQCCTSCMQLPPCRLS